MLALVTAEGTRLDAGSVGLALARRWSESGDRVLLVDADPHASGLARRLGQAARADYSPAARGLPSLIVAREQLTLRLLAEHCYSLDTSDGSLWALFAPSHPDGAKYAAGWLAERTGDLMALHAQRSVIVSGSLGSGWDLLEPLPRAAQVLVVLAPVESGEQAKALWTLCRDAGLMGFDRRHRVLVVEGESSLSDDEIGAETSMHVAGRLPVIDDERVLRLQSGRRDRAFCNSLDKIASRLQALSSLSAAPAAAGQDTAVPELHVLDGSSGPSHGNGAAAPDVLEQGREPLREQRA